MPKLETRSEISMSLMNSFLFPHVLLFILDYTLSPLLFFLLLSLLVPCHPSLHMLLCDSSSLASVWWIQRWNTPRSATLEIWELPAANFPSCLPQRSKVNMKSDSNPLIKWCSNTLHSKVRNKQFNMVCDRKKVTLKKCKIPEEKAISSPFGSGTRAG